MGKLLQAICIFCILALLVLFIWMTGGTKTPSQKEITEKALKTEYAGQNEKDSGSGYHKGEKTKIKTSTGNSFFTW